MDQWRASATAEEAAEAPGGNGRHGACGKARRRERKRGVMSQSQTVIVWRVLSEEVQLQM